MAGAAATAVADGGAQPPPLSGTLRELIVEVPAGAKPGYTKLRVSPEGEGFTLQVAVPLEAVAGDRLVLREQLDGDWACCLQRHCAPAGPAGPRQGSREEPLTVRLPCTPVEGVACFERMKAAAESAGAFVSPKLERACALAVPGIVAREAIAEGEVLVRMPSGLHISPETCAQVMPGLHAAVEATARISEGRRSEVAQTACLAALLRSAEQRLNAEDGRAPRWRAPELWHCYAEALLGEKFDRHPYWLALKEPGQLQASFEPSGEAAYARMMAGDAIALHEIVGEAVSPELLDPYFDVGLFLQARLSLLTREFATPRGSALVPLVDFCNHASSPGVRQKWSFEDDAMVVLALRSHEPGEEVCISYGPHSNPLLLRTYGFTLPPCAEPNWTYACQVSDLIEVCREVCSQSGQQGPADAVAGSFLPLTELHLDCTEVTPTLATALEAFAREGGDAQALLKALCGRKRAPYDRSPCLRPALERLRRAREVDARSPAWWERDADAGAAALGADEVLRVKMSEYLCLTAHLEALDLASGRGLREEECLPPVARLAASIQKHQAELGRASDSPANAARP